MNTRPTFPSPAIPGTRNPRMAFSPITMTRTPMLPAVRRSVLTGAPIFRAPPLEEAADTAREMRFPAWHRGPLDRLQAPLTRFRD